MCKVNIKEGFNFDDWDSFKSYAVAHYLPLLDSLGENHNLTPKERKLVNFLHDDLKSLINNS